MSGRHHGQPRQRIGLFAQRQARERAVEPFRGAGKLRGEGLRHFRSDFVAAAADRGAERGDDISGRVPNSNRMRPRVLAAMRASVPRQPACTAATARVRGVREQDRHAIGGLDGEQQTGLSRDDGVAATRVTNIRSGGAEMMFAASEWICRSATSDILVAPSESSNRRRLRAPLREHPNR